MSRRVELYIFAALIVVLGYVLYHAMRPSSGVAVTGVVAADGHFRPLDVQEPELHLDLLDNLRKSQYTGTHRDIFEAEPIAPPKPKMQPGEVPVVHPGPPATPPLQVPVQFFGYASARDNGRRVGFFSNGDDVLVLAQGDTFLDRYRLVSVTDTSAEVMEISTGRRETLPITQPPGGSAN